MKKSILTLLVLGLFNVSTALALPFDLYYPKFDESDAGMDWSRSFSERFTCFFNIKEEGKVKALVNIRTFYRSSSSSSSNNWGGRDWTDETYADAAYMIFYPSKKVFAETAVGGLADERDKEYFRGGYVSGSSKDYFELRKFYKFMWDVFTKHMDSHSIKKYSKRGLMPEFDDSTLEPVIHRMAISHIWGDHSNPLLGHHELFSHEASENNGLLGIKQQSKLKKIVDQKLKQSMRLSINTKDLVDSSITVLKKSGKPMGKPMPISCYTVVDFQMKLFKGSILYESAEKMKKDDRLKNY